MPGVLERRGEDVDLRWWRGWRCLGERERRRRGLGVEDGYGRRGEREGEVDMGRRWRARWRPGEREWWWRGLGVVDGYGWRGERGARRGVWGEACLAASGGAGVVVAGAGWPVGGGEGDMGRRWRLWWCPGERERRERGPWGSWWYLGERERREWVVEARWECGRRGRVCRAGGERERRRLRDRPSSLESGQSGSVGGLWGGSRGAAWGGRSPVVLGAPSAIGWWPGGYGASRGACLGGEVPRRPWGPFGHRMVAAGVRLVRGWWLVRGGWVCGRGVRRLPSRPLVLLVYGGLWPGGVGRWAVVVVGVVLVVVVMGPLLVVVCVVVGLVLRVWPMESLWVFRSPLWGWGVGHRGQSPGLHYVVGMEEGLGAGLDGDDG